MVTMGHAGSRADSTRPASKSLAHLAREDPIPSVSDSDTAVAQSLPDHAAEQATIRGRAEQPTDGLAADASRPSAPFESYISELLGAAEAMLSVPRGPVELPVLDVLPDAASIGRVFAPHSAHAIEVVQLGVAPSNRARPGETVVLASFNLARERNPDELPLVMSHLATQTQATASYRARDTSGTCNEMLALARPGAGSCCIEIVAVVPTEAPEGDAVTLSSVRVAGRLLSVSSPPPSVTVCSGPDGLTSAQASQVHAWLGSRSGPCDWTEVYRATRDGFDAATFHTRCDDKRRLLVIARERSVGSWLFGGFTEVGFIPGDHRRYDDPDAFLFSLTNPAGRPEKLASLRGGNEIYYRSGYGAAFGIWDEFAVADGADVNRDSYTNPSSAFARPWASGKGSHPMSGGKLVRWTAAEVLAWTVPP